MKWEVKSPKYGDIVRTKVSFYHHYGIFLSPQRVIQFGLADDVRRPAEEVRVLESDVYAFLCGGELEVGVAEAEERGKLRPAEEIVSLALSRIGEGGYDILHNNCEHFVNECAFGEKNSSFIENVREKLRKKLGK